MKNRLHIKQLVWLLLLAVTTLQAQWQNGLWTEKQAYNWYFGQNAGLDFHTSPPSGLIGAMNVPEGSGSISDSEGNLLFYTDGVTVWNKEHDVMENGEDLIGDSSSTQTGLIVPAPGDPNKYYIFSVDGYGVGSTTGLAYSEVDMTLDGGLGAVTENKNIVLSTEAGEKVTAVHHADGQKVWVICHTGNQNLPSNTFKAFLISADGVSNDPVESSVGEVIWWNQGQMKISPDGTKLAVMKFCAMQDLTSLQVFDFNADTGEISNPITLTQGINQYLAWGVEFSPNNRFLYSTEGGWGFDIFPATILQFDLNAGDQEAILNSVEVVFQMGTDEESATLLSLQVGPDGKIYVTNKGQLILGVINFPNNLADFAGAAGATGFDLSGGTSIFTTGEINSGLPDFIQSYFESGILYEGGHCPSEDVTFSTIRIPGIESVVWDFGDPDSGDENASSDLEPTHAFSGPGIYTVTAVITSNGAEQTATTEVIITAPDATIPMSDNLTLCANESGNALFNLSDLTPEILNGQDPTIFTVSYYASEEDLAAETPIAEPATFTTTGQIVYAKVTSSETGCSTVIEFMLVLNPLPQATEPVVAPQCADAEGTAIFDLTQYEGAILGDQNPAEFVVTFYATEAEMKAGTPITTPENFVSAGQFIQAVVTDSTTGCEVSVAIELPVAFPSADDPADVIACDSYELPALSANNAYWTGMGGTGEQLSVGQIITENVTLYILATSPDNPNCTAENVFDIVIRTVDITFEAGCEGTTFWLEVLPTESSFNPDSAEYLWAGPGFTSAQQRFAVPTPGTYTVTVTTADGCIGTESFEVEATTCEIPRGISPNGDGMNDNFDLLGYDVQKLSIFNRYGQEVYSRANYTNEWSGQSDNGNELPSGTYYYMIERKNGESKTGWVYINQQE